MIQEAHGEVVTTVSPDCEVLAKSEMGIEMFVSKNGRVLGIQGHPEYTTEWLFRLRAINKKSPDQKEIDACYQELLEDKIVKGVPDYEFV